MPMPKLQNETELSDIQLWAISLSAMLTQLNRDRHDRLRFHDHSESYVKQARMDIKRDWEISSAEDLRKELRALDTSLKASTSFFYYKESMSALTLGEKESMLEDPQRSAVKAFEPQRDEFLYNSYSDVIDRVGTDAWNDGRAVWLCRVAFDAGLISEEEAWEEIFTIAKRCSTHYQSWEEFGLSYAVGFQNWKPSGFHAHDVSGVMFDLRFLLFGENSPWRHVAWEVGETLA